MSDPIEQYVSVHKELAALSRGRFIKRIAGMPQLRATQEDARNVWKGSKFKRVTSPWVSLHSVSTNQHNALYQKGTSTLLQPQPRCTHTQSRQNLPNPQPAIASPSRQRVTNAM
jgi:hypothetical protein